MKTLDEVIAEMEGMEFIGTLADALCYLKNYRIAKDLFDRLQEHHREIADRITKPWKNNPPLTWDELCKMEGKPVWVEDNLETPEDITKYWAIMRRIEKAEGDEYALLSDLYYEKSQYGKDWQAYRKEQK